MRLGHAQPCRVLLFPDPLQRATSRPWSVLCPRPAVPFLRSLSYQSPSCPSRPNSRAAFSSSSVEFSLIVPGRIHPCFVSVPIVNSWSCFVAHFIMPRDILGCFDLFLPHELFHKLSVVWIASWLIKCFTLKLLGWGRNGVLFSFAVSWCLSDRYTQNGNYNTFMQIKFLFLLKGSKVSRIQCRAHVPVSNWLVRPSSHEIS